MAVSLYYKETNGSLVKIETGGGGKTEVSKAVSTSRGDTLTAGTAFEVPAYELGSGRLQVFLDGLLCLEGESNQYVEASTTTIKFNDDIPADMEIVALVL